MSRRPDLLELPDGLRAQIQAANARTGSGVASGGQRRTRGARTGRVARAGGERAEDQVRAANRRYAAEAAAWVKKRPTPVKVLGPVQGGRFRACWEAKAGCDFAGVLAGGRGLVMELKTSSGPSLPLAQRGKLTLKPSQAAELEQVHQLGGLALVLVRLVVTRDKRPVPVWVRLDWPGWCAAVAAAEAAGAASLGLQVLLAEGVLVEVARWLVGLER